MNKENVHILLVEDDEIDAELVRRAYRRHRLENPFTIARDGVEALEVLRGNPRTERLPRPYMILLDINMPRMNGIEFLREVRKDAELRRSIVFVLTTSNNDEDKLAAYNEQIAGYLLKGDVGEDFHNVLVLLDTYWSVVEFPPEQQR